MRSFFRLGDIFAKSSCGVGKTKTNDDAGGLRSRVHLSLQSEAYCRDAQRTRLNCPADDFPVRRSCSIS
jgi:hypothetical protein